MLDSVRWWGTVCWFGAMAIVPLSAAEPKSETWKSLFDGKSLAGWKITRFGGEGEVKVEAGRIVLDYGNSLTGITYTRAFPKTNYEIELEASRLAGTDFFCALTFPVADSHASLILGGWGGTVVGISSIDGQDASENETTQYQRFEEKRWYHVRVRVTPKKIQVWLDKKPIIDQSIEGRKIGTRPEVDLSKPLGIATWETRGAVRKIRYRRLTPKARPATSSPAPAGDGKSR